MPSTTTATPFPLGVYLSNPDNSSQTNEAAFEASYAGFVQLMGTTPQFLVSYVDYNQPISQWIGNSMWAAASFSASADAKGTTPVIGLPMASNAAGSLPPDQQFQAFASGQYDSALQGIVQAWVQQGFKSLVFRPGWEMNLQGPTYAGSDAQSQADWVKAFQHIYTVLHQAAAADGVNVQVVWNPSTTNYSNAEATTNLYPGDSYVDVVGADAYADIHPYSDGSTIPTYHDWDTGKEDTSVAQFIADPINRQHYWTAPAATEWSTDSSGGHSQSFGSLIQFAEQHNKPFALPETGAGSSNSGTDVSDDAAFPQWVAQQLTTAQAAGEKIDFINLWDSNGGSNYRFSSASDNKPNEAAAWAKYFGAPPGSTTTPTPVSTPTPTPISTPISTPIPTPVPTPAPVPTPTPAPTLPVAIGVGADTLALTVSEDAWQGDAQFTVSVDGTQIGGVLTATALNSTGQVQVFNAMGNFGAGTHTAAINFLNDAYGGSAATDRNLYVKGATIDNVSAPGGTLALLNGGAQSFSFNSPTSGNAASSSSDKLDLHVSEDAWQGDAQFTIRIDGTAVGGTYTATASHAAGATQDLSIAGQWGAGPHTIGITFINDAWGGSASADRNLYVDQATYDGRAVSGTPAALLTNSTANLTVPAGNATTALTLHLAEDAWQGDAQYSVSIDGASLVANGIVTALNSQNQSQAVNLKAVLSAGMHDVAVSFLNDAWGGTAAMDRNLYVKGIDVNGTPASGTAAALMSNAIHHFQVLVPSS